MSKSHWPLRRMFRLVNLYSLEPDYAVHHDAPHKELYRDRNYGFFSRTPTSQGNQEISTHTELSFACSIVGALEKLE